VAARHPHTDDDLADALWRSLDQLNQSLGQALVHLTKLHAGDPNNYESAVKYISSLQPVQVRCFRGDCGRVC
jgi:phosphomevalonate kinase